MWLPGLEKRAPTADKYWKPKMYGFNRLPRKLKKRTAEARFWQIAGADRWQHLWKSRRG